MLNKHKRWFHSSRVKFPLVSMSASWFLVSMYLIWVFGSKLIRSINQSTLWVLETGLIVGLLPFRIILSDPIIESGNPVQSQSSVQRDDFGFCWIVWNWSLFLAHPTKRMTSIKRTMFLLKWILNLQDLPQNRSLETVPACIVLQYYPHDNTVCIHMCDEW